MSNYTIIRKFYSACLFAIVALLPLHISSLSTLINGAQPSSQDGLLGADGYFTGNSSNADDIVTKVIEKKNGVKGVMAQFDVSVSKERIWAMLTDHENITRISPNVNKIKVISEDKKGAFIEYWLDTKIMETNYVLHYYYTKKYYLLKWTRSSGDMKSINGSWQIKPLSKNRVRLTYTCYVVADGAFARVSNWIIERWAQAEAKEMALSMIKYMHK